MWKNSLNKTSFTKFITISSRQISTLLLWILLSISNSLSPSLCWYFSYSYLSLHQNLFNNHFGHVSIFLISVFWLFHGIKWFNTEQRTYIHRLFMTCQHYVHSLDLLRIHLISFFLFTHFLIRFYSLSQLIPRANII